jgi:hypothetical protein
MAVRSAVVNRQSKGCLLVVAVSEPAVAVGLGHLVEQVD